MFKLIKFAIWLAGFLVIAYFILDHYGYAVNQDYFNASKKACQQKLQDCSDQFIRKGIENAKCDFVCTDPKLIINKKK